ncbi:hypothetical protein [Gemmata sp.]|uniref:hypothetical protein n=1 Tax=Gemmata sp. TaxID=1914242 RepID=UPI003F6FD588
MTPRDWQTSTDPHAMLEALYPVRGMDSIEPQTRRSRLYLLACARRAWDVLPGVCRAVVRVAEVAYCEAKTKRELRDEVYPLAEALVLCRGGVDDVNDIGRELVALGHATRDEVRVATDFDPGVWRGFSHLAYAPFEGNTPYFFHIPPELHSPHLLREVFGNPFRWTAPLHPNWRTDTVVNLARHAHATTDFSTMPILADALQDAGCDRDDVLDHLRRATQHARGCWVLEAILTVP